MTEGSWVEIGGEYSIGGGGGGFIRTDLLSVCTRIVRTHLLAPTTTVPATEISQHPHQIPQHLQPPLRQPFSTLAMLLSLLTTTLHCISLGELHHSLSGRSSQWSFKPG